MYSTYVGSSLTETVTFPLTTASELSTPNGDTTFTELAPLKFSSSCPLVSLEVMSAATCLVGPLKILPTNILFPGFPKSNAALNFVP